MIQNILTALLFTIICSAIHTGASYIVFRVMFRTDIGRLTGWRFVRHINQVTMLMLLATLIEATLWALLYLGKGALETFESALYFSLVTYTTLGYGEITLGEQWRLMASLEAATGILMFGWSTAIIIAAVQRLFSKGEMKIKD